MSEKTCPVCSKPVVGQKNKVFCTRQCKSANKRKRDQASDTAVTLTCVQCNKAFTASRNYYDKMLLLGKPPKYCSQTCVCAGVRCKPIPLNKTCTICDTTLPYTEEFFAVNSHANSRSGLQTFCKKCHSKTSREPTKKYQVKLRTDVLTAYGNGKLACVCCGTSHYEFLTLEHSNSNGNEERKKQSQTGIYTRLRRDGYPSGYETLCFNCNCSRGIYGYCPHRPHLKVPKRKTNKKKYDY